MSQKPEKPDESECCGSGCKPCIMDVYEEKLKKWELNQEIESDSLALSQSQYLPFLITSIKMIAEDTFEYQFQAVTLKNTIKNKLLIKNCKLDLDYYDLLISSLHLKMGQYLILKGSCVKQDGLTSETISRSYTPVLCNNTKSGTFKVIIKLYPTGLMSQFLKTLTVSDVVFWRGPYEEFKYKANSQKNLLLIGGGTGMVPLYNIAKEIVENDEEETWVKVLASFRSVDCIILREDLNKLKQYWNYKMDVYVTSQNNRDYVLNYNESFLVDKKIDEAVICNELKKFNNNDFFIVISGPRNFNQCMYDYVKKNNLRDENIFVFW